MASWVYIGCNLPVSINSFSRFGSIARNCCRNGMNIHHVVSQVVKWAVLWSRDGDFSAILVGFCQFLQSALTVHFIFHYGER